jgi:hypothetical protein
MDGAVSIALGRVCRRQTMMKSGMDAGFHQNWGRMTPRRRMAAHISPSYRQTAL